MINKEIKVVKQAMLNEIEGYEFYKLAASNAKDAEVKAAFENLAEEERKHVEWLRSLFDGLKSSEEDEIKLEDLENPPSPRIFKWDKVDRDNAGLAVSVFGIGMQMEKASVDFYEKAAEETELEVAETLYKTLAKWEQVHYDQFATEYENLRRDYWSDQAYFPF